MQFEWEEEPWPRVVRLVSTSAQVGDPVRVTVAGVEVEDRIEAVESSSTDRSSPVLGNTSLDGSIGPSVCFGP